MSNKLYYFILNLSLLIILLAFGLFQFAESLPHIGAYELILDFTLLVKEIFLPFMLSVIIWGTFDLLITPQFFFIQMTSVLVFSWIHAFIVGIFQSISLGGIWSRSHDLYKNGISNGTLWVFIFSSYSFSLPFLVLLFILFGVKYFLIYIFTIFTISLLLGATGDLLEKHKIIEKPNIITRPNPEKKTNLIQKIFLSKKNIKKLPYILLSHISKNFRLLYLDTYVGIIGATFLLVGIDNHFYRTMFEGVIQSYITVILLALFPLPRIATFIVGYAIISLYSSFRMFFIFLIFSFIWRFIQKENSKKWYSTKQSVLFIITLIISSLIISLIL